MKPDSPYRPDPDAEKNGRCRDAAPPSLPLPDCLSDRLLNAMQTSLIFFDARGTISRTNDQARSDLHEAEELTGRNLSDLLAVVLRNSDILPDLMARFDDQATEQVKLPPDTFIRRNDRRAQFFVSGCISRLDCGNFLLSFRNIVEELTQESLFKIALSPTRIFPWIYDFEMGTMLIDPRYFEYTGIESPDHTMTVETFTERLHPDDRAHVGHTLSLHMNGEHYPYPVPFRLRRGDGRYEWFEAQSTYLSDVEGIPYRIVGTCMSTQAHKDIEEALTLARDKAEQSDRLKSAFLANMSHEIRTPLNAIVGFSDLLAAEEQPDREESREYAALINRNCNHLLTLVSDVLDLSRIETGAMEYNFSEQSLGRLLTEIHLNQQPLMPEGVAFNLLLPADDAVIETDALRLRQVMGNLLNNAAKFTSEGHIDLGFLPSRDRKKVRLFVTDTGRGIPPEEFDKIFERFYKIDPFVQGAGLGLSLCKTIAGHLGGTITVSSAPGAGSRFTLLLPLKRQDIHTVPNS